MALPLFSRSVDSKQSVSSPGNSRSKLDSSRSSTMSSVVNSTTSSISTVNSKVNNITANSKRKASSTLSKTNGAHGTAITTKPPSKMTIANAAARPVAISVLKSPAKPTSPIKRLAGQEASDNEPIKAFLRIRPAPEETVKTEEEPYIEVISETEVLMNPPKSTTAARARVYSTAVPTKYTFSRVFSGHQTQSVNSQASFYKDTALPLVEELMQGQSGLLFTYGVTNSGKSYTVQGGAKTSEAGILPRSMDTIFNSIQGLESVRDIRPVGLSGIKLASGENVTVDGLNPFTLPGLSKKLSLSSRPAQYEHDTTKVKIDRNYRYSIWVSYIEVYNEKIFDLLDVAPPSSSTAPRPSTFGGGFSRSESFRGSNWTLAPLGSDSGPIYLQRRPLTLKNDVESGGKYVAGLQEIRVQSAAEARELLERGQENRQVFGTMANRASSRSHGVFTVKLIREHAGEKDLSLAFSTSRLSIVDLAGSERLGNTSVTGDRLKEAGSINKSLMCLGQCLETLRKNQARAASFVPMPNPISSVGGGGGSTMNIAASRMLKRRPSIVSFRHSKLTELFQSFFTGEGRAVMIVNVNPFDTGFDENSHVMRFSAAAKEVQMIRSQNTASSLSRFVHPSLRDLFNPSASPAPSPAAKSPVMIHTALVAKSTIPVKKEMGQVVIPPRQDSKKKVIPQVKVASAPIESPNQEVTIIEEDDEDDNENQSDSFVDHLMAKYEEVRHRLYQSERQCSQIEAQVREEMAEEMSRRLQEMEDIFNTRIVQDSNMHDDFINKKLDLFGTSSSSRNSDLEEEEEDDDDDDQEVEQSLRGHVRSSHASMVEDQTLTSQEGEDDEEEEGDDGVLVTLPKRKAGTRRVVSMSELEEEDSIVEQTSLTKAKDTSIANGEADATIDEFYSSEGEQEEEEESEEEEEEDSDSDASFDVTKESIESSFEAAPKRTSRGRVSKPVVAISAPKRPVKSAGRKVATPANRNSTNGLPLMEKSANISLEADCSSDASLVIPEKKTKSPKKRKLTAKKSGIDQEALMDQIDSEA